MRTESSLGESGPGREAAAVGERSPRTGDARADAALLLCALLLLASLFEAKPGPLAEPCPQASERRAERDLTRDVSCRPSSAESGPLRGPARLLFGLPLDVNLAGARSLGSLPGIGPRRARAIVEERARRPFASLDDLRRVAGLGPKRVAALEGWAVAARREAEPAESAVDRTRGGG